MAHDKEQSAQPRRTSTSDDNVVVTVDDLARASLTDILIRTCRKTLDQRRQLIDVDLELRSITITIKLTDKRVPHKVFLTPTHESTP